MPNTINSNTINSNTINSNTTVYPTAATTTAQTFTSASTSTLSNGGSYTNSGYVSYTTNPYYNTWSIDSTEIAVGVDEDEIKKSIERFISSEDDMMPLIKKYLRGYLEEILDNPDIILNIDEAYKATELELDFAKTRISKLEKEIKDLKEMLYQQLIRASDLEKRLEEMESKTRNDYYTTNIPGIGTLPPSWITSPDVYVGTLSTADYATSTIQLNNEILEQKNRTDNMG